MGRGGALIPSGSKSPKSPTSRSPNMSPTKAKGSAAATSASIPIADPKKRRTKKGLKQKKQNFFPRSSAWNFSLPSSSGFETDDVGGALTAIQTGGFLSGGAFATAGTSTSPQSSVMSHRKGSKTALAKTMASKKSSFLAHSSLIGEGWEDIILGMSHLGGAGDAGGGLGLIEELLGEEENMGGGFGMMGMGEGENEGKTRRIVDVEKWREEYERMVDVCEKMREEWRISSESESGSSDESDSSEESSGEEDDGKALKSFSIAGTNANDTTENKVKTQTDLEEEEFLALTPERILLDLQNTMHGRGKKGPSNKQFRAAHALSMRRKLSSYHRNGIPNAMRAKTKGRRGSAFESSRFMRRVSMRNGLGVEQQNRLKAFTDMRSYDTAQQLLNDDSESEPEDDTTEDQTDHYHSYHLYSVYESLHKPRISCRPGSARTVYLRTCESECTAPLPIFDHIRQNASGLVEMKLTRYGIGDKATVALGAFLSQCPLKVNSLEVAENSIHNRGMAVLLSAVGRHQMLRVLDVSHNSIKWSATVALSRIFTQPEPVKLMELKLSGCKLGDKNMGLLAQSMTDCGTLTTLQLDRNNLAKCGSSIGSLLSVGAASLSLTDVDLSWNQFRGEDSIKIAKSLQENQSLTKLNLSWNHFGLDVAIFAVCKFVSSSEYLHTLDISYNKIKERGSICIADSLKQNKILKKLTMDGNPVGPTGGKALLKMIANEGNMREISLEKCNFEVPDDGPIPFDINEPNGFYTLDLSIPYDRMIAKSLQELAYTQGGECWRGEKLNGVFFDFPEDDPMAWSCPEEGILELAFVSNRPIENSEMNANQFSILKEQLKRSGKHDERNASNIVKSLSETFAFNSEQVGEVIDEFESSDSKVVVATRLFTQVSDAENAEKLLSKLNQLERKQVEKRLGQFYYFNPSNPTGHYRLNLSIEYERMVATKICEVNTVERLARRLEGKLDLTQKGNWENFRNESYDGVPFTYDHLWKIPSRGTFEFDYVSTVRPESEATELTDEDFDVFVKEFVNLEFSDTIQEEEVSLKVTSQIFLRPRTLFLVYFLTPYPTPFPIYSQLKDIFEMFDKDGGGTIGVDELSLILKSLGQLMSTEEVEELFQSMDDDGSGEIEFDEFFTLWESIIKKVKQQDRIITLRRRSANFFLSSEQISKLLKMFTKSMERVEVFIIFFCRLVDEECMFLCLDELTKIERQAVMHRLGPLNLFNPFRPDGFYKLDLSQHDTHLLAEILIKMAVGENGKCLFDERYNGFGFSLPVTWIKDLPKKGVYELRFSTPKRATKNSVVSFGTDVEEKEKAKEEMLSLSEKALSEGEGNLKLRRIVAEDFLGWEFHEEENEADQTSQHDALARRRSSALRVNMDIGQIQEELRKKGIELSARESKILLKADLPGSEKAKNANIKLNEGEIETTETEGGEENLAENEVSENVSAARKRRGGISERGFAIDYPGIVPNVSEAMNKGNSPINRGRAVTMNPKVSPKGSGTRNLMQKEQKSPMNRDRAVTSIGMTRLQQEPHQREKLKPTPTMLKRSLVSAASSMSEEVPRRPLTPKGTRGTDNLQTGSRRNRVLSNKF